MQLIKQLIGEKLPNSNFLRGVSILAGGNAAGQLIAIIAAPLLTRLYTPEDFGALAVYMSITTILGVVVCMRFELAIPLQSQNNGVINATLLAVVCAALFSTILASALIFYLEPIAVFFQLAETPHFLWLLPLATFLIGMFNALSMWCVSQKHYSTVSTARIYQVLLSITTQLALSAFGAIGLVGGQLISQLTGASLLHRKYRKNNRSKGITGRSLLKVAKQNWRLPIFSSWAILLNRSSTQLPALMFAALFGPSIAGMYALAIRVVNTPGNMVGSAIQKVFLSTGAEAKRSGNLGSIFSKMLNQSIRLIGPCAIYGFIVAPDIFTLGFGEDWTTAGKFAQFLVIVCFFQLTVSPLMSVYIILKKQHLEAINQGALFTVRFLSIYYGYLNNDAVLAIALYSISSAVVYSAFLIWAYRELRLEPEETMRAIFHTSCWGLLIYISVIATQIALMSRFEVWISYLAGGVITASSIWLTTQSKLAGNARSSS